MVNSDRARSVGVQVGILTPDMIVAVTASDGTRVKFLDCNNKEHTAKLYYDEKVCAHYFKYNNGSYYFQRKQGVGLGKLYYKTYRRNGDMLVDEFGTRIALSYEGMQHHGFA